ncbi:DcaP family trimeric outer membrane transporter [Caulobacter sp. 17J65-9]|uniref:DcaP family trimeric outer membrane transporter n=1 Tax=Caulobacter sp. 17J65-9 TaxID=2709382 RepID=UPI001969FD4B|nr:DcaP family trimeric outer membrane transporter [Caulobacter sp. 17J65-9]
MLPNQTGALRPALLCGLATAALIAASPFAAHAQDREFEAYGFADLDYIQDFRRVDPDWEATLRASKIPTSPGLFGGDGKSVVSVRQTRFGVKGGQEDVDGLPMNFKFEFDFFGVGADAGQTTIRLRHAYGEWGHLLAGQTNSLFMDGDIFPNVIDYWGPGGMVFLRNPQVRWTFVDDGTYRFAVAAEQPNNDIDSGRIREIDPDLGSNIQAHDNVPDLTAQFRYTGNEWGYVQLAGILRNLGFETLGTVDNRPKGNELGWGLDLTSNIMIGHKDKILAGVVYGQGIASYMNDGGVDLAPEGVPGDLSAEAVKLLGLSFYYDHYWNDRWSTSFGWSQTKVDNTDFQAPEAFQTGQYASINLLFTPAPDLLFGGEFLWGQREDNDDTSAEDYRIQLTAKYSFSSGNIL